MLGIRSMYFRLWTAWLALSDRTRLAIIGLGVLAFDISAVIATSTVPAFRVVPPALVAGWAVLVVVAVAGLTILGQGHPMAAFARVQDRGEEGQGLSEYVIIILLIAIVAIPVLIFLGKMIAGIFKGTCTQLQTNGGSSVSGQACN